MEKNILKTSDVSKIYLKFTDGKNHQRKELVTVRYMDDKHYYFNGRVPTNFDAHQIKACIAECRNRMKYRQPNTF